LIVISTQTDSIQCFSWRYRICLLL